MTTDKNTNNPTETSNKKAATKSPNAGGILIEGLIFRTIQLTRHFKDSKYYVDHVVKKANIQAIYDHFRQLDVFRLTEQLHTEQLSHSPSINALQSLFPKSKPGQQSPLKKSSLETIKYDEELPRVKQSQLVPTTNMPKAFSFANTKARDAQLKLSKKTLNPNINVLSSHAQKSLKAKGDHVVVQEEQIKEDILRKDENPNIDQIQSAAVNIAVNAAQSQKENETKQKEKAAQKAPLKVLPKTKSFPQLTIENKYHNIVDEFVRLNFFKPGFELLSETPIDYKSKPTADLFQMLATLPSDKLLHFALAMNELWKLLHRVVAPNVANQHDKYSFIPLKHRNIYVPGGRFREIYYWDSYWIVCGLLSCDMVQSSIRIVENCADLVERLGFVPNGTRNYYRDRSQPPLLTLMVDKIYQHTKDKQWLATILPSLEKEHLYWTKPPIELSVTDPKNENVHKLARYYSVYFTPRPESYYEDVIISNEFDSQAERERVCHNIRATAASGWDFSSRWYFDEHGPFQDESATNKTEAKEIDEQQNVPLTQAEMAEMKNAMPSLRNQESAVSAASDMTEDSEIFLQDSEMEILEDTPVDANKNWAELTTDVLKRRQSSPKHGRRSSRMSIASLFDDEDFEEQRLLGLSTHFALSGMDTINIVPVELNTYLCKVELALSKFNSILGNQQRADMYRQLMQTRIKSMVELLWDESTSQFRDWNVRYQRFGNPSILSNFIPLWCTPLVENEALGISLSKRLIEAFRQSGLICDGGIVTTLYETGEQWDWPNCWAPLNHIMVTSINQFGERELALQMASTWISNNYFTYQEGKKMHEKYNCKHFGGGGGGEYTPQIGFGWTNGVVLDFLRLFAKDLVLKDIREESNILLVEDGNDN